MRRTLPRAATMAAIALLLAGGAFPWQRAVTQASAQGQSTRQQLVGAWQLVSIEVIGPNGRRNDPFYNADPSGVLVYDASGWMSVQIAGSPRPAMQAHASRPGAPHAGAVAQVEAAVLDTYYAYAGTWEFDTAASTVTHHVTMSLIPGETGHRYTQTVHVTGDRLTFTTRRDDLGDATVQEKVWRRVAPGSR